MLGKVVFVVLPMASFMALTAYSFFRFRLKKKKREFQKIIKTFKLEDGKGEANRYAPSIESEYSPSDYYLPVAFATLVTLAGFSFFVFSADLLSHNPEKRDIVLTGPFGGSSSDLKQLRWESALVIIFAFLSSFAWSAYDVLRRLVTADLTPGTYYHAALRIVWTMVIALVLSWVLHDMPRRELMSGFAQCSMWGTGKMPG
jgi:hypothetical protein